MLGVLVAFSVAQAACDEPVDAAALGQAVSIGEAAYISMDEAGFRRTWDEIQRSLPCLSEPVTDPLLISLYRSAALHAFLERDEASGVAALQALLSRSPHYSLSPTLAPEAHPLQAWRTTAFENPSTLTAPYTVPRKGTVWVDGDTVTGVTPVGRPYVLQYADADGTMVLSALVMPGQTPPVLGPTRDVGSGLPLAVLGGLSAVAAGGTYALARQREATFNDLSTPTADLAALRQQANLFSALSVGAGVAAVGTGAAAVLVGTW